MDLNRFRLLGALAAACFLAACAGVGVAPRATPMAAPLTERALDPGARDAYARISGSAGTDGAQALYYLGLDKAASGDWAGAATLWRLGAQGHPGSGWDALDVYQISRSLQLQGLGGQAFLGYQSLLNGPDLDGLPERSREACLGLVGTLAEPDARALLAGGVRPEFVEPLRLHVLTLALAAGRTDEVRRGVDAYLLGNPQGQYLDQYEALADKLEASVVVDRGALGLIVPESGPMAAFGDQVEQGVRLALDAANFGRPAAEQVRLVVADEGGDPSAAARAATDLVEKSHVIGVLGPLSSDSAEALVPLLPALRTPFLSPSATRPDLAGVSPWFFRDALSPEGQASAMADFAVTARKLTRVASLAPDDYYGSVSARAFERRVKELGGVVEASVTFAPGTRDFREAMLSLGGVDPGVEKGADQDEMRDQQEKVEEACNAIGRALQAGRVSGTSGVRLLVVDFAQDTDCAKLNAGRAFADRFARTLARLGGVEVIGPQAALRYWTPLTPTAEGLSPVQAAEAAQAAGADFVLTGSTSRLPSDPARWPNRGVYALEARLQDALTATTCARKEFTWTQYQAPPSNSLGIQAVYMPASAEDVAAAVPDMLFFDLGLPLLGSDQWDRPELRDHLPELEGDVFTTSYWGAGADPAVKRFDASYRSVYAAKPDVLAAQAYDAASLMAKAVLSGVSTRSGLRSWLSKVSGYDGACGHFGFKGGQDAIRGPALVGVSKGALVLLKEP